MVSHSSRVEATLSLVAASPDVCCRFASPPPDANTRLSALRKTTSVSDRVVTFCWDTLLAHVQRKAPKSPSPWWIMEDSENDSFAVLFLLEWLLSSSLPFFRIPSIFRKELIGHRICKRFQPRSQAFWIQHRSMAFETIMRYRWEKESFIGWRWKSLPMQRRLQKHCSTVHAHASLAIRLRFACLRMEDTSKSSQGVL